MNAYETELNRLARQVKQGDATAAAGFRARFEPSLKPIVRRVLYLGRARDALERRILSEFRQLAAPGVGGSGNREGVVEQIAQRICDLTIARLRMPLSARDTVPMF
jgi:hypothetical protein